VKSCLARTHHHTVVFGGTVAVDLGEAQIGVIIGVEVFDQFIAELFAVGALPQQFQSVRDIPGFGTVLVTIKLDVPQRVLGQRPAMPPHPELLLTGLIELRPPNDPEAAPLLSLPLDIQVFLDFILVPAPSQAPTLGLVYGGFAGPTGSPVSADQVDELFADPASASPSAWRPRPPRARSCKGRPSTRST
jgi:hypothetical protein